MDPVPTQKQTNTDSNQYRGYRPKPPQKEETDPSEKANKTSKKGNTDPDHQIQTFSIKDTHPSLRKKLIISEFTPDRAST